MGLFGSEYWTYVLPRRVGEHVARTCTRQCDPIGTAQARRTGWADRVMSGDRETYEAAVVDYAGQLARRADYPHLVADKRNRRDTDEQRRPLQDYRRAELDRMWSDIAHDVNDFANARRTFLSKRAPQRPAAMTA